tara:strand:- start:227 stop:433 length:207 start_codon:yes stop_codon:yes gene_type:complete
MTFTFRNIGKTYSVDSEGEVTVTHNHDSIVSVSGEYFKNKYTGEWLSELEVEQAMCQRYEEDETNRYY